MFYSAMAEIAQERIARAERQQAEPRSASSQSFWVEAVHRFIRSAIAPDGNEIPDATPICFAGHALRVSRPVGLGDFNLKIAGTQPIQGRTEQFAALSAARRRIHYGQIGSRHDAAASQSINGNSLL